MVKQYNKYRLNIFVIELTSFVIINLIIVLDRIGLIKYIIPIGVRINRNDNIIRNIFLYNFDI